jgi:YHS domain-containing protein
MKKLFVVLFIALFSFSMISLDVVTEDKKSGEDKKVEKKCCSEKALTCPVMGHAIKDKSKAVKYEHKGKTYYFCCEGCVKKFKADPAKYMKKCATDCKKECCDKKVEKKKPKKK